MEVFYDYENIPQIVNSTPNYQEKLRFLLSKKSNSMRLVFFLNGKYYYLGSINLSDNQLININTINYKLRLKKVNPIKNLGYFLLNWVLNYVKDDNLEIKSILRGAEGFYEKSLQRLLDEGKIKKVEYIKSEDENVGFDDENIIYTKIIVYK